jgi:hypothetical protein
MQAILLQPVLLIAPLCERKDGSHEASRAAPINNEMHPEQDDD